ncbi:MAG: hypothetical protein JNL43_01675 [Flavobacteriales bacterium]|nr:hypothetical protein [Flavobacteriales bacterium]
MELLRPLLILAVCGTFLTACRKDQAFTDESGITLDFSKDTVLFDTIFTQAPFSVNKRFTVHNPSSNAVRVDIALEGGSPSPYRINVDGASGVTFDDVEIYGGDSLFIFVEVTLDQNNSSNPFIIEDHILFNTNGKEQEVLLLAWGQDAHFIFPDQAIQGLPRFSYIAGGFDENGNQICETVIWPDDLPYVIYGYGVVDSCCTLIIDPGVDIYMHGGAGLWVYRYGQVKANGDISQEITFQGDRLEPAFDELPGQWDRIWLNEGSADLSNEFSNVLIKNALVGIQCEPFPIPLTPEPENSLEKVRLSGVKIRNCSAAGILSRNYTIEAENLLVTDCGQYSVALTGNGRYQFNQFTIANYFDLDIRQTPAFYMNNVYVDYTNTQWVSDITNSTFQNGIIHGANENEFLMEFNDLAPPTDLSYFNMLFRTTEPTNSGYFPDQGTIYRNQSPGFVDVSGRDFHLTSSAFARNKANGSGPFFDLDGVQRSGERDLGCYEYTE